MMTLAQFNQLSAEQASQVIAHCVAIPDWQRQMVAARPFTDLRSLLVFATELSHRWGDDELAQALTAHPRIGEQATAHNAEGSASRNEQSQVLNADQRIKAAIAEGNKAYEQRFSRIFLIRAKGRSPQEILHCLQQRLQHDVVSEQQETLQQLREITCLRLEEIFR